jgi:Transglutaminase-like superfamily
MKAKLKTALSFSAPDWILLAQAWLLLLAIDIGLRTLPFRKVQSWIKPPLQKGNRELQAERIIQRSTNFLDLAARHHLYPMTCLRRSLTLQWLLAQGGLDTTLQFGVRRENGTLQAHAWLDYQGRVIDKSPISIEQYANLKAKEAA